MILLLKIALNLFKRACDLVQYTAVFVAYYLNKYSIFLAFVVGATLVVVFTKLLYFASDTWVGFLIEILDKLINSFDKLVQHEPKSALLDELSTHKPTTNPTSNSAKMLSFGKKALVWATVGGLFVYSGLFALGLSFGFTKLILVSILPYQYYHLRRWQRTTRYHHL